MKPKKKRKLLELYFSIRGQKFLTCWLLSSWLWLHYNHNSPKNIEKVKFVCCYLNLGSLKEYSWQKKNETSYFTSETLSANWLELIGL